MWILPSTCSPSAPAEEVSISESGWLFQLLERSAMWRSKPTPARSWERAWKRATWMRRLCGRISQTSTAVHGVASWISSLEATRANPSVWQENNAGRVTPGICGPTSGISSATSAGLMSSSRTSPTIYEWDSKRSMLTYDQWVTALRRVCLQRRKSARATNANASSSWPTPVVPEGGRISKSPIRIKRSLPLTSVVHHWAIPRASDGEKGGPHQSFGAGGTPLPSQAVRHLESRDWRSDSSLRTDEEMYGLKGRPLSRQAQTSSISGGPSSNETLSSRRQLNPAFVEWLMGWPRGWTACVSSATELSLWRQRMRSELFRMLSHD